jgi:hypothetical protein
MGMPSWSNYTESSAPQLRLNAMVAATDISTSEVAQSRESGGAIGDNTSVTAFPAQDHHTPLRTVRKKKSSYDLRDEFRHPASCSSGSHDFSQRKCDSTSFVTESAASDG